MGCTRESGGVHPGPLCDDRAVNELEEGTALTVDFDKVHKIAATGSRVVPVVLQDVGDGEVLFIGYANELALQTTLDEGIAVLWSSSRNELWHKGATSGDVLDLDEVRVNCEQNSLLYRVIPRAGVCHTVDGEGNTRRACYYRRLEADAQNLTPVG